MNVLLTCVGRRNYIVDYFKQALGTHGYVYAANSYGDAAGMVVADKAFVMPSIYDPSKIDIEVMVDSEEAFEMTRKLAKCESIFAGMSSGAAMIAAAETAKNADSGIIVTIFPDRGDRYLSTDLYKE